MDLFYLLVSLMPVRSHWGIAAVAVLSLEAAVVLHSTSLSALSTRLKVTDDPWLINYYCVIKIKKNIKKTKQH